MKVSLFEILCYQATCKYHKHTHTRARILYTPTHHHEWTGFSFIVPKKCTLLIHNLQWLYSSSKPQHLRQTVFHKTVDFEITRFTALIRLKGDSMLLPDSVSVAECISNVSDCTMSRMCKVQHLWEIVPLDANILQVITMKTLNVRTHLITSYIKSSLFLWKSWSFPKSN